MKNEPVKVTSETKSSDADVCFEPPKRIIETFKRLMEVPEVEHLRIATFNGTLGAFEELGLFGEKFYNVPIDELIRKTLEKSNEFLYEMIIKDLSKGVYEAKPCKTMKGE